MDYLGSIIIFLATFCILLALNWGGNKFDWDSAPVLAPLVIGALLVAAFVFIEQWDRVVKYPIIPSGCERPICCASLTTHKCTSSRIALSLQGILIR